MKKLDSNKMEKLNKKLINFFNKNVIDKGLIKGSHEWNYKGKQYEVTFERKED